MAIDDSSGPYKKHVVLRIVKVFITLMNCIQTYNIQTMEFVKLLNPVAGLCSTRLTFRPVYLLPTRSAFLCFCGSHYKQLLFPITLLSIQKEVDFSPANWT
jgi:hypothetical protein